MSAALAIPRNDADGVRLLLSHAETHKLPNLRVWCKAWLDPTSQGARDLAELYLRAWAEQGDASKDARV